MNNILYIGPYKENTGMGRSARRHIDALGYNFDVNLSIRPIYFTPYLDTANESGKDYSEFEDNSSSYYDIVIQYGIPNCFEYKKNFGKNICITDIDTLNIGHTGWVDRMNLMDHVVVQSQWSKRSLEHAGFRGKINIIPEPFNLSQFHNNYDTLFKNNNNDFVFYYIGKHQDKNNIKGLLSAFFLEFRKHDDAKLIIKTDMAGFDHQEAEKIITYDIQYVEKVLRVNSNHVQAPHVIIGYYEQEYLMRLHNQCDCYVNVCKAESFGASAIESALFGKLVITNHEIGSNSYINKYNGFEIQSMLTNVTSKDFYMENTFTVYEQWKEPFIDSIREQMRKAYETTKIQKQQKLQNFNNQQFAEASFVKSIIDL
jgi:hypothetical protein